MRIEVRGQQRAANDVTHGGEVGTAGKFGHDTTKISMDVERGFNNRATHVKTIVDDGGGRLVATRFNSQ